MELTDRQQRELAYHRQHAAEHAAVLAAPFSFDVLNDPGRRWWNAYWAMYAAMPDVRGKRVLVVGCGFGDDALRLAKLGADVDAFDLSPESLNIARSLAEREGLSIRFEECPAERLSYSDATFDLILARDILHHVDIEPTMRELRRVAKPGALFVVNEIYSHSWTERVRRSRFVDGWLYQRLQRLIYGPGKPYITQDERKLTELDLAKIAPQASSERHFNFIVTRLVPDRFTLACMADRALLAALRPFGRLLAGRVLMTVRL